jgi:hypothetical protein
MRKYYTLMILLGLSLGAKAQQENQFTQFRNLADPNR